ncbi:Endonuclease/exonuclease/phosphatase [Wallemia mellicola]|uniref:Endonuclease/exonuclease/phosphatase n=1 Tax=Wallemia mellicola TaxID=1708541 RepID=A0A4T0PYS5_9BASI|nr:hypothetical protein E3Q24_03088 [Wallemia mellicola]TIB73090.1 hypothetical protein E3Q23_03137 [Wallemia mellicola]TIB77081.1 Endonuclease/exonuclease/phosphatase [Wallemia mellicola]TIB82885.1 Endonuclease/exonuclease/phosphatase [Wallemia mellicola]TIB85530.1 Endonuclease/exonuclease/phosphatase [Wallemia mellicola]
MSRPAFLKQRKFTAKAKYSDTIRVATWNTLSQSLVKRDLYPGSNCLKLKDRLPRLLEESTKYSPDVLCLQEVDQLDKLKSALAQYNHVDCFGRDGNDNIKKHGLVIFYKESFQFVKKKTVSYDSHTLWPLSRKTNNVGLVVALRTNTSRGFIVATSHLFWHPAFVYERTRQTYILLEQADQLRKELSVDWPILLCGDLNSEPHELVYQVLVDGSIDEKERQRVEMSRVSHSSVLDGYADKPPEQGANLPMTNSIPNENCPTPEQLIAAFKHLPKFESAYDNLNGSEFYSERDTSLTGRRGANEPKLTNYMPKFGNLTLDYILYERNRDIQVEATLNIPSCDSLAPGLPKLDVTASDHLILAADLKI